MKNLMMMASAIVLAGCASTQGTQQAQSEQKAAAPTSAESSAARADSRLGQAVTAPLSDLNLVRAPIPPVLAAAQKDPYGVPKDASCTALQADVEALDAALGADLDTPVTPSNPSLIERGNEVVGDAVVGAVRSTAEGVIPFRGWVRKLTGAEKYSREVAAAIAAGTVRRAYLKGLGQAAGCAVPAAPRKSATAGEARSAA